MAFSSIWIERIEDGASTSGLNQRFTPPLESDGEPWPEAIEKPAVLIFGLFDSTCCFPFCEEK